MKRVYIACPITVGDLDANLKRARAAMLKVAAAGHAPLNPALSCFADYPGVAGPRVLTLGMTHDQWVAVCSAWVVVADAVLRVRGESKGADAEVVLARSRSIPVFEYVTDLLAFLESA